MKLKNTILLLTCCLLLLFGIIYYIAVNRILPYSSIRPHRITREEISILFPHGYTPNACGLKYDTISVFTKDSILLKGWFIYSPIEQSKGTVILLHGIANCKESLLGIADTLAQIGFNSLVLDFRAHGESGGLNCTFGYYEKWDISACITEAEKRYDNISPVGIYGNSLGGAIGLQVMAIDKRIACGVIECPFATLREVVYDYWKEMAFLPIHFIPDNALANSEQIAHFYVDSVKPQELAKQINNPVLLIHGEQDKKISIEYGKRIYRNLASPAKQWYPVPLAGHYTIPNAGGIAYWKKVKDFFKTFMITPSS